MKILKFAVTSLLALTLFPLPSINANASIHSIPSNELSLISPTARIISPTIVDGRTRMREYITYANTTGERREILKLIIRYHEYVDSSGSSYISSIDSVYAYGGDYSAATFAMANGYPTYSGIGTTYATISGFGTLTYSRFNYRVNFKVPLQVGSGYIIK